MYLSEQQRKWLSSVALLTGALMLQPALAQSSEMDRQHVRTQKWPQATLQAQASAEVQHDTVNIVLATEVNGKTQAAVAKALNTVLEQAMKDAKGNPKVKASSGNYRIWPMNDRDGKISDWRGHGEILLESSDFVAASDVATLLSDRVPVASLAFSVSPQARAHQEQLLLGQAAQAFSDRAENLAKALGYSGYTLKEINLSGAGARYDAAPRVMMASMGASAKSSVPLEGGTEQVSVVMQGSIFLQSAQK